MYDENFEPTLEENAYLAHQISLAILQDLESHVCADSCASHHITSNIKNLQHVYSNTWPNNVVMGNAQSLEVKIVGHSKFYFNLVSKYVLNLTDILQVPSITRNLIFVS